MNNNNNNSESWSTSTKIAVVASVVAATTLGGLYIRRRRNTAAGPQASSTETNSTATAESSTAPQNVEVVVEKQPQNPYEEEGYKKAQEIKNKGNANFKDKKYAEAIKDYTEAISLSNTDVHLLYSNRALAYMLINDVDAALADAKMCIETKPDWSKGYYRCGTALGEKGDVIEAYINYIKGITLEPTNKDLKSAIDQTKTRLPPFGERAFKYQFQAKLISKYLLALADEHAAKVGVTREQIQTIVSEASKADNAKDIILQNEVVAECMKKDSVSILCLITILLLIVLEKPALALAFSEETKLHDSTNAQVLVLSALTQIRQPRETNHMDPMKLLDVVREALVKDPTNILGITTYVGFVTTIASAIGNPEFPIPVDVAPILSELKIALAHPLSDKLQLSQVGFQLWFKYFADPSIQEKLLVEEREAELLRLTPHEAYVKGIVSGAFRKIAMDPFFLEAMADVLLPLPQLESIMSPFRSAFLTISHDNDFNAVEPLIHAFALQAWRNDYLWETADEEKKMLAVITNEIQTALADINTAAPKGVLTKKLYQKLCLYAMYMPLSDLDNIENLVMSLDLSKLSARFLSILNKQVLAPAEEKELQSSFIALTPISDSDLTTYYNSNILSVWDSPPFPAMCKITLEEELKLRYPYYTPNLSKGKIRVLIVGCGSGREIYQIANTYENVEITAIDISEVNLAYAERQNKDLGVKNVKYYLADVMELKANVFPSTFDLVLASDILHYLPNPQQAMKNISDLVKPGGLIMLTLHNRRAVSTISAVRKMLSSQYKGLVDKSEFPKVLRTPTDEELRDARRLIIDSLNQQEPPAELSDLMMSLGFYSLHEFRDLLFHPMLQGFSYAAAADMIKQSGLNVVGFDFPELYLEKELQYKGANYDDRKMLNAEALDKFDAKDPSAFAGFYLSVTCEKPLNN